MSEPAEIDADARGSALGALVRLHQAGLWRYLRFLGCAPSLADDLVQETFLAVWRRPFQIRSESATRAYLRQVARNLFLMEIRRRRSRPPLENLDAADAVWEETCEDGGGSYLAALEACLDGLTKRASAALTLAYRDRAPRARIATALGMRPDGVKTLLRRARQTLRTCIEGRVRS